MVDGGRQPGGDDCVFPPRTGTLTASLIEALAAGQRETKQPHPGCLARADRVMDHFR